MEWITGGNLSWIYDAYLLNVCVCPNQAEGDSKSDRTNLKTALRYGKGHVIIYSLVFVLIELELNT